MICLMKTNRNSLYSQQLNVPSYWLTDKGLSNISFKLLLIENYLC